MDLLTHIFSQIESLGGIMGVKWTLDEGLRGAKHVVIKLYSFAHSREGDESALGRTLTN